MNYFQPTPNPIINPNHRNNLDVYESFDILGFDFESSGFLMVENHGSKEDLSSQIVASSGGSNELCSDPTMNVNMQVSANSIKAKIICWEEAERGGEKSNGEEGRLKVAFRTKSEMEIMDDGFKWRKYGKKMVKASPNPRNYYKCSSGGCKVKKRVERDSEDPSYVITTYDGVHNHQAPSLHYYNNQSPQFMDTFSTFEFKPSDSLK